MDLSLKMRRIDGNIPSDILQEDQPSQQPPVSKKEKVVICHILFWPFRINKLAHSTMFL